MMDRAMAGVAVAFLAAVSHGPAALPAAGDPPPSPPAAQAGPKPPAAEDRGVPWSEAIRLESPRFELASNAPRAAVDGHWAFLEDAYQALRIELSAAGSPRARKTRVFLLATHEEFETLVGSKGLIAFYMPEPGSPAIPPGTIVTYHDAYHDDGTTRSATLGLLTARYLELLLGGVDEIPPWLRAGLAGFYETGRHDGRRVSFDDPGSPHHGIAPRRSLHALQRMIAARRHASLREVLETPRSMLSGFHRLHAWSIVYWIANEDRGTHRGWLVDVLKAASRDRVTAEDAAARLEKEMGASLEDLTPRWEAFVTGLALPPAGVAEGGVFRSHGGGLVLRRPPEGWKLLLAPEKDGEGSDGRLQDVWLRHRSVADARIGVVMSPIEGQLRRRGRTDPAGMRQGIYESRAGKVEDFVDVAIVAVEVGGHPAGRLEYVTETVDLEEGKVRRAERVVLIPLRNRVLEVHARFPEARARELDADLEKLLDGIEIVDAPAGSAGK